MEDYKEEYAISLSNDNRFPVFPIAMEVNKAGVVILELADNFVDCGWGVLNEEFEDSGRVEVFPDSIYLAYIGIVEKETYVIDESLNGVQECWEKYSNDDGTRVFSRILIGIAPYGSVACWLWGRKKSVIVTWAKAVETIKSTTEFCDEYLKSCYPAMDNLAMNGYPPRNLYENYMKQYRYRYSVYFEEWSEDAESGHWSKYDENQVAGVDYPELDYMDEALCDGTHDKLHDGGLMKYHDAGKPDKIAVRWHIAKSEYDAYFWFDRSKMSDIYDKFYGVHRDVQSDFIFRIDVRKKKYELSMFRYGLRQPVLIPEEAYQVLVFKDNFENFRSENYAQYKGAWIW